MTTAATSKYSSGAPPDSDGISDGRIRMPSSPAPPSVSAHSDHRVAAITPSETSVSIVDAPCRAARAAAVWNGHAPHVTTGSAAAATTHCQPVNCSAGIIDSATTGTVRIADATSRRRRSAPRASPGAEVSDAVSDAVPDAVSGTGRAGVCRAAGVSRGSGAGAAGAG